jgi:hypothetical protein
MKSVVSSAPAGPEFRLIFRLKAVMKAHLPHRYSGDSSEFKLSPFIKTQAAILTVCIVFLGVLIRFLYWDSTSEFPFSDMADFERVAHHVVREFSFRMDDFWLSYKPPVLPALRAMQITILGEDLFFWRCFLLFLTAGGLLWLYRELLLACGNPFLGVALLFVVALSKSSVFWSYKLSTEGVSEAFLYLSLAGAFYAWRSPMRGALPLAVILTIATLNRPNSILSLIFFPILLIFKVWFKGPIRTPRYWFRTIALYSLGICLVWGPWMYRSYSIYGHVVPLNTSGPSSFIYGVWQVPVVKPDGREIQMNWEEIMAAGPKLFKSDYEFYVWANSIVSDWLVSNWREMPRLIVERLNQGIIDRDVQLTQVSRINLFQSPINDILLDKGFYSIITGLFGLCMLPLVLGFDLILIPALSIHIWLISGFFQGNPRFLEPVIPILLFGNCVYFLLLLKVINNLCNLQGLLNRRLATILVGVLSILALGVVLLWAYQKSERKFSRLITSSNSDFESAVDFKGTWRPDSWELGGDGEGRLLIETSRVHSGDRSVEVQVMAGSKALYQDLRVEGDVGDQLFSISMFVMAQKPGIAYIALSDGVRWYYSERNQVHGVWEQLQISSRLSDAPRSLRIHLYVENGSVLADTLHVFILEEGSNTKPVIAN